MVQKPYEEEPLTPFYVEELDVLGQVKPRRLYVINRHRY